MSSTIESLAEDLAEEGQDRSEHYKKLVERTAQAGHKQAAKLVRAIMLSEEARFGLYRECLGLLGDGSDMFDYYVCPHCGLVLAENPPETCLLCDTPGDEFVRVS